MSTTPPETIRLVIFDWAGTTVDQGCFAPVVALTEAFRSAGVTISDAQARGPMGLHKRDHIRAVMAMPPVAEMWKETHSRDWTEDDVDQIYHTFLPRQAETAREQATLIEGVTDALAYLRERGIRIGTTTGYPRAIGEEVAQRAATQGYVPDYCVFADDVPAARPAPWMIYRNMEGLGVYPPGAVLKVGDTVPDIQEGRNAGIWSAGVTDTGSEVGLAAQEWSGLSVAEREERRRPVVEKLQQAAAHAVIPSLAQLPQLIDALNERMHRGERP